MAPYGMATGDGMNLFNALGNEVENMEDNKDYYQEKVLVNLDQLLTTARGVISPPQYKIFVLPLALTYLQITPENIQETGREIKKDIQDLGEEEREN